jgi:hypothetical protein
MNLREARKLCRYAADLLEREANDIYHSNRAPNGEWWHDESAVLGKADHDDMVVVAAKLRELAKGGRK